MLVLSVYRGVIPRYSPTAIEAANASPPADSTASTSANVRPASASASLAASAWSCMAVLGATSPRSDSATPAIAATRSVLTARQRKASRALPAGFLRFAAGGPGGVVRVGLVPGADRAPREEAEQPEGGEPEEAAEDHRGDELLGRQPGPVEVDQDAEPRLALPEEEVADDGAGDAQAGRDAHAGQDRRQRRRELEADETAETAGVVEGEQVAQAGRYRAQAEQRAGD